MKIWKKFVGTLIFITFFILVVSPLFIFSDILPNKEKNVIKGGRLKVDAIIGTS